MMSATAKSWFWALPVILGALGTPQLRAQTVDDQGLWTALFLNGEFGESDFLWWFDGQPRFLNDANGLDQLLLRPGVGYAFEDNASVWLGYAFVRTNQQPSGHTDEHRIWQQLTWNPDIELFKLMSRTRLEQRTIESRSDLGWRFRQMLKGTEPIGFEDQLFVAVYDELFIDLNDTDWGQDTGFSQNRLFAGFGWRFDDTVTLEIGYLNQYIDRTGPDKMNHILNLNLFFSF